VNRTRKGFVFAPPWRALEEEQSFGWRLRQALERIGKTQDWLHETYGWRRATVSGWINGKSLPEGRYMIQLPKILRCNGHWLLTGDGPMDYTPPGEDARKLAELRRVLEIPAERFEPRQRPSDDDQTSDSSQ
jgi:hypothetical protein